MLYDVPIKLKRINPLGFHLLQLTTDPTLRLIIMYGGSSSGKSYSMAQAILYATFSDGQNTLVMRKVGASISKTIYEDFKVAAKQLNMMPYLRFKDGLRQIVHLTNGAKIDFSGLDDPEKIKGISNYKRVCMDEWSEFDSEDFKQIRKRLRGKEGQQIITTFNPIKETHWIKREIFDTERWEDIPMDAVNIDGISIPPHLTEVKSMRRNKPRPMLNPRTKQIEEHAPDTVVLQSTYLNNFWVVGSPDGTYGYYDEQCIADFEKDRLNDPDYYNVYALGEWGVIRTGSEFFGSFNRAEHVKDLEYDPHLPIHICVDNNVLPYITCTYWQVDTSKGSHIRQIGETCAESPNNTVRKSAKLVAECLNKFAPTAIYLHGDASTRNASTIDDEKRSFLDLFIDTLSKEGIEVTDMVGKQNPSVSMSGEFINAIFDSQLPGLNITIGEECKTSVEDYLSVQKDVNGAILKTRVKNKTTGQSYEEHGHISDTFRYLVCDVLKEPFLAFSNRRKRNLYARDGFIHFYNPDTSCAYTAELVYCMPNINGKLTLIHGKKCGDKWHIVDCRFVETASTDQVKQALTETECKRVIIECSKSYYMMARDLRSSLKGDIRVIHESADLPRRIAATSDYVRESILFNESALNDREEYSSFMTCLLDYNKNGENMEASAVMSGFIQAVLQLGI